MTGGVLLDISQLLRDPCWTGIQRVERQLIRHWPGPAPLVPVRYDPRRGALERLPDAILDLLCRPRACEDAAALAPCLAGAVPLDGAADGATLLCLELFESAERAAFLVRLGANGPQELAMVAYDFLPWLHPQFFAQGGCRALMPYLRALRAARRIGFISEPTQREWRDRISRGHGMDGPVLPLGGDGLGLERQVFTPQRRGFVMLGTVTRHKNVLAALHAFEQLWAEGKGAELVLVGRVLPEAREERAALDRLAAVPWLRHLGAVTDAELREVLRGARALVSPGAHEGFGLGPYEALHAGIPVIVQRDLPSIATLPPAGQIRLAHCDAPAIAAAVRLLQDDAEAARLWREAAGLAIPGWRDFAVAVADWLQADAHPATLHGAGMGQERPPNPAPPAAPANMRDCA